MNSQKISTISTSIVSFVTFLVGLFALIYYTVQIFDIKGFEISLVSEIYILFNLLFIDWVFEKLK